MDRASGVLMHISSLWGNYSCGNFGKEAKDFIDFLKSSGFSYWQTLPFCFPDEYFSPYCSYSAFSLNYMFIDLTELNKIGLITNAELAASQQDSPYLCEFERLKTERFKLLKKASLRYKGDDVKEFIAKNKQVANFCRFMALKESNGSADFFNWSKTDFDSQTEYAWQFTQYFCYKQWQEIKRYANDNGIKIIGDIPMYVSLYSSDVWSNRDMFLIKKNRPEAVAGVPPDFFSADGQLWGNPLYDWSKMQREDFSWWRQRISFMCELFDGVRIDHFRAFESYYSIPYGSLTAKDGVWVKGPGIRLIEALKESAGDKLLIAEDLGTIDEKVHALVKNSGFPGMRVLQFGFLEDQDNIHIPHNYVNNCVAYTGTHDNNTLLGYVWELDGYKRKRLLDYIGYKDSCWDNCYDEILRTMLSSAAGLVIFPIQDILKFGSDTRLNTPGKAENNWRYRITRDQLNTIDTDKLLYWNKLYSRI